MKKLTVEDLEIQGKRVLMRVDFNVPLKNEQVADDQRIRAALPTIDYILSHGGRLILMSHLGRPKGSPVAELSLRPCADRLAELLGRSVRFVDDCVGPEAENAASELRPGEVLLLENLRFHKGETDNDAEFAKRLAKLGEVYVNDAFGTAHRAHASTEGVTHHMARAAAGFLMMKELDYLGKVTQDPQRPFIAILGGAKISGKIDVIEHLLPKVDRLLIGGGMAFTFFKAKGLEIGNSLLEADKIELASQLLKRAGKKIVLPVDCRISDQFDFKAGKVGELVDVAADRIPAGWTALDIGPKSIRTFEELLSDAKTIVWNGPMGVFEIEATAEGTYAVARALAGATDKGGAVTVVGGGDSAAAIRKSGVQDHISHVSTGGGASLEFLEGKVLPGVAALSDR
ncbi:MAG: phosphoglycerate kinase [Desulfobacterales bacterium]|nr:phosphoglycerate kinase [Desulfobacterales bacterium]